MSAEVLRRAASRIYHDVEFDQAHDDNTFLLAVANWLDATSSTLAHVMDDLAAIEAQPAIEQLVGYDFAEAITVARAYLGESH